MNRNTLINYSLFITLLLIAYFIQTQLFYSPDITCLLYDTELMLRGGKYATDIFETNPPMILYLNAPVCLIAKWTGLNTMLVFRFYVFILALISISISYSMLRHIIKKEDRIIFNILRFMVFFVLLILPLFSFGQREHFLMIFMMPYLFSTTLTLENKLVKPQLALFIGLFAGLGFALKPFFLAPFILIELYAILKKRNIFAWFRIETLTICAVIIIYLFSVHLYQPLYYKTVLPLVMRYYFISAIQPWMVTFLDPIFHFCLLGVFCFCLFYKKDKYPILSTIICLALIGMTIAFLIPRTPWAYHTLPAFGFACLLTAGYLAQVISANNADQKSTSYTFKNAVIIAVTAILIYIVPLMATYHRLHLFYNNNWAATNPKMIAFFQNHPGKNSIYCFTTIGSSDCFPLIMQTHSQLGGRFNFIWWMTGLKKLENEPQTVNAKLQLENDKRFLINTIAEDWHHYQTKWIIINTNSITHWEKETQSLASQNTLYRDEWKHYHYATTINNYLIYQRD